MAPILVRVFVVLSVFDVISSKSMGPIKSDKGLTENEEHVQKPIEYINIDNELLNSFNKNIKKGPNKGNSNVRRYQDTTDDEDSLAEGSGSGMGETSIQTSISNETKYDGKSRKKADIGLVKDLSSVADERKVTEFVLREGGVNLSSNKSSTVVTLKMGVDENIDTVTKAYENGSLDDSEDDDIDDDNGDDSDDDDDLSASQEIEQNPCLDVSCLFGATCVIEKNNQPACVCPVGTCANHAGNPVCGSDGNMYENPCELEMAACEQQKNISLAQSSLCEKNLLPECPKARESRWSPWSMWFESGDSEFRFRVCINDGDDNTVTAECSGETIQERMCKKQEVTTCTGPLGTKTKRANYKCSSTNVKNFPKSDTVFSESLGAEKGCLYSLYDAAEDRFVHSNWTYGQMLEKADTVVWCSHRGMFIPFTSPYKICTQKLNEFCSPQKKRCKPAKKKLKSRGDKKRKCWRKFLLGESLPVGLPLDDMYYICQKFSTGTDFAAVYGEKSQYVTLYDSARKTPFMSFGTFSNVGHNSWPAVPYMIEKALDRKESSKKSRSWYSPKKKSSGLIYEDTGDKKQDEICNLGVYQSLPADYDDTSYEMTPLLSPKLVGGDVSKTIATMAVTNSVPLHISIYNTWQNLDEQVRRYATERCGLPLKGEKGHDSKPKRKSYSFPEMYVVAGRVPSTNTTIGNDVNVPYLVWMAGCCVRGAEARSFSAYVRNIKNGPVVVAPVEQLEVLLSDLHNTTNNVHLFPAFGNICSNIENDVSDFLKL